jgi:hypothetical protein
MEKTNWIEKIKEAVRVAMNKELKIIGDNSASYYQFIIDFNNKGMDFIGLIRSGNFIEFFIQKDIIRLKTPKGEIRINYILTDRDDLELKALALSIKEYREDMAISEFEEFISDKKEDITDINDLDDDN